MGKKIENPFDLVTNVDQFIRENKQVKRYTDEMITMVPIQPDTKAAMMQDANHPMWTALSPEKNKFLNYGARKMTEGPNWAMAYRPTNQGMQANPVSVLAENDCGEFLFIVQPRATLRDAKAVDNLPKAKLVISLPAGLREPTATIDSLNTKLTAKAQQAGKTPKLIPDVFKSDPRYKDPAMLTALLELKEETGYFPLNPDACEKLTPIDVPKTAGLTDEADAVVKCKVDSDAMGENMNEKTEDISFFWMKPEAFMDLTQKIGNDANAKEKITVEYNAWMYMRGLVDGLTKKKQSSIICPVMKE